MYRADQHSYLLYPERGVPGFLAKNIIDAGDVHHLALVKALVEAGDTRLGELGLVIERGRIAFNPVMLNTEELFDSPSTLRYFDVYGQEAEIDVPARAVAYTFCQVPIVLQLADEARIELLLSNGQPQSITGSRLSVELSHHLFLRDGFVRQIRPFVQKRYDYHRRWLP